MKILFVCHDFPPYKYAGAQLWAYYLAKELQFLGHEVSVFHAVNKSLGEYTRFDTLYEKIFDGLKIYNFLVDDTSPDLLHVNPAYCYENTRAEDFFETILLKERFDMVHYHLLFRSSLNLPGISRRLGIKSVATLHDYWFLCALGHLLNFANEECSGPETPKKCALCLTNAQAHEEIIRFFHRRKQLAENAFANIDEIYSPSAYLKNVHCRFGLEKIKILPLGWLPVATFPKETSSSVRFGYLGQIIPRKGLDLLIKSLSGLSCLNWELHVWGNAGKTTYFHEISQLLESFPQIYYHGGFTPQDLSNIYRQIDVCIIPSRKENYPLTLLESLSAKVPVLVSEVGGVREILDENPGGITFACDNEAQLKERLNNILLHPEIIGKLQTAIKPIKTMEQSAKEYQSIYKNLQNVSQIYTSKEEPLISVLLPTFNRPRFLIRSIKSVLEQTYENFEIIVVNDGGLEVKSLLEIFPQAPLTYIRHAENLGLAAARNTALKAAKGTYIAFLDDDDIFYPQHLQKLLHTAKQGYEIVYSTAYTALIRADKNEFTVLEKRIIYDEEFSQERFLIENYIPIICFLVKTEVLKNYGGFDESLPVLEDWELWLRLSFHYEFYHLREITCQVSQPEDASNMSLSKLGLFPKIRQRIYDRYQDKAMSPLVKAGQKRKIGMELQRLKS